MVKGWRYFSYLKQLWKNAKSYYGLLTHKDTPRYIKVMVVGALVYLVLPYDFIPDWFIGFGIVDDVTIISILVGYALKLAEKHNNKSKELDKNE